MNKVHDMTVVALRRGRGPSDPEHRLADVWWAQEVPEHGSCPFVLVGDTPHQLKRMVARAIPVAELDPGIPVV